MFKYANFGKRHANELKAGSYNGNVYTEHNNTNFVGTSLIFTSWGGLFVTHDDILLISCALRN